MSNRKTREEKLEAARMQKEEAESKIKELLKEQRKAARKARDNRLYKRAGIFESLLPDTINLTDEQFTTFLHATAANKFGKDKLAKMLASIEPKTEPTSEMAQSDKEASAMTPPATPPSTSCVGDNDTEASVA